MGWLIVLAVLVLLAWLPLGVSARYDSGGPRVRLVAGPVRLQLFPQKKKEAKKKTPKPKPKKQASGAPKTQQPAKGGSFRDFLPLVRLGLDFLGSFRRRLRITRLELCLTLAGDDPCDLAANYGRAWAALGNLWPRLEELFVIKKRRVEVRCDFEASQTLVTAAVDISITLGRLLGLAVGYGLKALSEYMKISNKRKGGAAL